MALKFRLDCVEQALSRTFYRLGKCVSRYPWPFLIVPLVVCIGLSCGIAKLTREDSSEVMYTPTDGDAKSERKLIQEYFPENHTDFFLSSRKTDLTGYLQIVFIGVSGSPNIYTPEAIAEIIELDNLIHTEKITFKNVHVSYDDICAKWKGQCSGNAILDIIGSNPANLTNINLTYPIHNMSFIGMQLGGVQEDENGFVVKAESVRLAYYLLYQTEDQKLVANEWMQALTDRLSRLSSYLHITPTFETALSMDDEIARATGNIIPLFSVAYCILMVFATVSTGMKDWVRCKTWVSMAGEISAVLAVGASLGLLSLCGVKYTSTVGTMPFLIVGIGIDNMFVLLSSWRHTNYLLPVEERMAQTFEKAAVSITLTSLTDALAFGIGAYTSFLSIQLFCAYTGVAVIFCYLNTITFFAATLCFSGRREAANRHEYTCMKALPKESTENKTQLQKIFCTGGDIDMENPQKVKALLNNRETRTDVPFLSNFLGEKYAPFLMHKPVRVVVIIIYFIYLGFSAWGCATLQEGLELHKLAPDDSYLIPFYENYNKYFSQEYGPYTMVAIHEPLDYSNSEVRQQVHGIINSFQQSEFFFHNLSESWLRDFEIYLQASGLEPANMTEFILILRSEFLMIPQFERYAVDLNFSYDNSQILGSRYMIQAHGVQDTVDEKELVLEVRRLADIADYLTTGYHAAFIFYDQYIVIVSNTVRNLILAAVSMLIVSLFLLPHPLAILWVTASVLSICFGVVGFMVFWDVNLDSISMINLIMCIGFSVDFSGHICYHYTICEEISPLEKVKETMKYLGLPIWQGAISTLLGVIVLSFSNSYIFRTFFKLIFLVIIFGFFHAMIILPVVLPTIGPGSCSKDQVESESEMCDATKEPSDAENERRKESPSFTQMQKENLSINSKTVF